MVVRFTVLWTYSLSFYVCTLCCAMDVQFIVLRDVSPIKNSGRFVQGKPTTTEKVYNKAHCLTALGQRWMRVLAVTRRLHFCQNDWVFYVLLHYHAVETDTGIRVSTES